MNQSEEPGHDRLDELLDDPPRGDHHRGRFAGYEAGKKVRRIIVTAFSAVLVVSAIAYVQYTRQVRHELLHPLPEVEATIDPSTPREMTWTEGKARLALGREAPAIEVIHLPDRDLVLAEDCDRAQVKIEVREGKTVSVKAVVGRIEERARPAN